ncbi:glutathione S-transferase family protein [Shewanella waksmanii]|uniref:glutathione S-transferase family protein n=1 Tax=Shewanella waksmanii TaxID=213783 RepID=UPI003736D829
MELFYHPLSRYSQKVLLALYEKQANFFARVIHLDDPVSRQQFLKLNPLGKLPLLQTASGEHLQEASIIIEYIDQQLHQGTQLISSQPEQALLIRRFDRLVDHDFNDILYQISCCKQASLDEIKLLSLHKRLALMLDQLDSQLSQHHWLCGDGFTLADCGLIPCLVEAKEHIKLYQYQEVSRYLHRATTRGAYEQVFAEVASAKENVLAGYRPIR